MTHVIEGIRETAKNDNQFLLDVLSSCKENNIKKSQCKELKNITNIYSQRSQDLNILTSQLEENNTDKQMIQCYLDYYTLTLLIIKAW